MVESAEEGPHPDTNRQRILRRVGALSIASGVALCGWASIAAVRPGPSGFILPIGIGFEAIFLGGLALAAGLPPSRRPAITRQRRVIALAVVFSLVTLVALAGDGELLRRLLQPIAGAPRLVRDGAVLLLGSVLLFGVGAMLYGTLYTLGAIGLAVIRWLGTSVRARRSA